MRRSRQVTTARAGRDDAGVLYQPVATRTSRRGMTGMRASLEGDLRAQSAATSRTPDAGRRILPSVSRRRICSSSALGEITFSAELPFSFCCGNTQSQARHRTGKRRMVCIRLAEAGKAQPRRNDILLASPYPNRKASCAKRATNSSASQRKGGARTDANWNPTPTRGTGSSTTLGPTEARTAS